MPHFLRSVLSSSGTSEADSSGWPGWYHGWCSRAQVERLLSEGPDGLYLMKNSTEFAGDLTLCLHYRGSVLCYRVRHTQDRRLTVDTDTTFSSVSVK